MRVRSPPELRERTKVPYKDKEKQREYQRKWMAKRRGEWIQKNGPCVDCASWEDLEIDHIDPSSKDARLKGEHRRGTSSVFSWSSERREVELAKCIVRCCECHKNKSRSEAMRGEENGMSLLTEERVREIRSRTSEGERQIDLAEEYGVAKQTVNAVVRGHTWLHVNW